jgi:hypothetical protein
VRSILLAGLKAAHTAIWAAVETCVVYLVVAGWRGRTDRRAALAAGVVGAETAIFLGNGAHCPLTGLAEELGASRGSVTDIFLPRRLARNLPAIHVPLLLAAAYLHLRNVARRRGR